MSALEGLREGRITDEFAILLYRQVRTVALARNFPPPESHARWNAEAVIEIAHEFFTSEHTTQRLTELAALSANDDDLTRLLSHAVLNYLRQRSRRTTIGRLVRRLKELLRESPDFTEIADGRPGAGNVTLASDPEALPFGGRRNDLIQAAYTVTDIGIVRWSNTTRREPPLADRDTLLRISKAVLGAANASLSYSELAAVVGARFALSEDTVPATTEIDDQDSGTRDFADTDAQTARPGVDILRQTTAHAIWDQFTVRERIVLAHLDRTVREIAALTNVVPSTAAAARARVTTRLTTLLANDPDAEETALAAVAYARQRLTQQRSDEQ